MKEISEQEANNLLNKLIELRSGKNKQEYHKFEQFCCSQFDYLVEKKLYKYKKFANYEDLKQEGRIALLLGIRSFKPNKCNIFFWFNQYIKTKIQRAANRHSTIKISIKESKKNQPYKVSQMPLLISEDCALKDLEKDEIKHQVKSAISRLPEKQRKIIELNGIKLYSINKISKELNMTPFECSKLLNEAKKMLKQDLKNY